MTDQNNNRPRGHMIPNFDKPRRCPCWSGPGWDWPEQAGRCHCPSGYVYSWDDGERWKVGRCHKCGHAVLPPWSRWLFPSFSVYQLRRRIRNTASDREERADWAKDLRVIVTEFVVFEKLRGADLRELFGWTRVQCFTARHGLHFFYTGRRRRWVVYRRLKDAVHARDQLFGQFPPADGIPTDPDAHVELSATAQQRREWLLDVEAATLRAQRQSKNRRA